MDFENKLFSFTEENHNFGSLAFVLFLLFCSSVSVLKCLACGNEYFAGFVASYLCLAERVQTLPTAYLYLPEMKKIHSVLYIKFS